MPHLGLQFALSVIAMAVWYSWASTNMTPNHEGRAGASLFVYG